MDADTSLGAGTSMPDRGTPPVWAYQSDPSGCNTVFSRGRARFRVRGWVGLRMHHSA